MTSKTNPTARETTPQIVDVDIRPNSDGYSVWPKWSGVDRPLGVGMACGRDRALADRYAAAVLAGVVFTHAEIMTDVSGKTFVSGRCEVRGRCMSADLRKLGY
jgi:hypothetical protein